ncbi:MAG: class I SAM-dependent methyltransferase [Petrotogaceae bacterium]|jgi:putative AdoMet-dependent methyltransferase|nr:class I SAM-dependent methyltransferase [Petrotogaceae bacterium]
MLDNKGFDLWADGYDKAVNISDEENRYPFAGYKNVLSEIYRKVLEKNTPSVLDIGFGTGILTAKLYEQGCKIYGQDFSAKMLEIASKKMEQAQFYQGDFSHGLVKPLRKYTYDFIIATYSLHHLTDKEKISFLKELKELLKADGMIIVGDIAFETRIELEKCRIEAGREWDDTEVYFVVDELKKELPGLMFERTSYCAGILYLEH